MQSAISVNSVIKNIIYKPGVSNPLNRSKGQMWTSKVTRGPYYDVDVAMAVPEPY